MRHVKKIAYFEITFTTLERKIRKGSAEARMSPTFAVSRRLNKNEKKILKVFL